MKDGSKTLREEIEDALNVLYGAVEALNTAEQWSDIRREILSPNSIFPFRLGVPQLHPYLYNSVELILLPVEVKVIRTELDYKDTLIEVLDKRIDDLGKDVKELKDDDDTVLLGELATEFEAKTMQTVGGIWGNCPPITVKRGNGIVATKKVSDRKFWVLKVAHHYTVKGRYRPFFLLDEGDEDKPLPEKTRTEQTNLETFLRTNMLIFLS